MKKTIKALIAGALGALLMVVLMKVAIARGVAPFEIPPSAAFLKTLGVSPQPWALLLHFGYGMFWSAVLVALRPGGVRWQHGLLLAGGLWLFMMLVLSPVIGWGVFGFGADASGPLALGSPVRYAVATAVLHAIYGGTVGVVDAKWIRWDQPGHGYEASAAGA
jgi:hypothetical protein